MRYTYRNDNYNLLFSILMILLGLVLLIWPGKVMSTAMALLGVALLVSGALSIWSWTRDCSLDASVLSLAEGIALAIAGIIVLLSPRLLLTVIPLAVGGSVVLNGILNLAQALDQRRMRYSNWRVSLMLAILTLLFGVVVILRPFSSMEMLVAAIGVVLLYNGASNLWIESRYRSMRRG